jgi:uncharacterized Ntn-hydrolase superfamily protein
MRLRAMASLCFVLAGVRPAGATYSIVACERATRQCGVAVQTDNLAVGGSVPSAQAGVGAIASQFETHPRHGPRGLELLARGVPPEAVIRTLLAEDGGFDGGGPDARQLAIVALDAEAAVHTGADAAAAVWAGSRGGPGFSVQGNGLAGPHVLDAAARAYAAGSGSLADRLLAALRAADAAGGQRTGRQSAALLVRTPEGFPFDVDLRVDDAPDPVGALIRLHDRQAGRQQIIEARLAARRGDDARAHAMLAAGVARVHAWPRALVMAAGVAAELEAPALATRYLAAAFARQPARRLTAVGAGTFAAVGHVPAFQRWIGPDLLARLDADARAFDRMAAPPTDARIALSARLLEAGRPRAALGVLDAGDGGSADRLLLRARALHALGRTSEAREACRGGLGGAPADPRFRRLLAVLDRAHATTPDRRPAAAGARPRPASR